MTDLNFSSDNIFGVSPQIMEALSQSNVDVAMPYGNDSESAALQTELRSVFEHDSLEVLPVVSGCAANCICLSAMVAPDQAVLCHELAHINTDERGGPEFYTSGAKLIVLRSETSGAGNEAKISAANLRAALESFNWDKEHVVLPAALSLTQLTERGTCYSIEELGELCQIAHDWGLKVHMDGARFANALVSLGCSAAEMTWKVGIDALSFGATKNGAMCADPVVLFDPELYRKARAMRKRGGHTVSKMRYIAAQMHGYLKDDHWLENARTANQVAAAIASGLSNMPPYQLQAPVQGNELFVSAPPACLDALEAEGVRHYRWKPDLIRLVCGWTHSLEAAEALLAACRKAAAEF